MENPIYRTGNLVVHADRRCGIWWIRDMCLQVKLDIRSGYYAACASHDGWVSIVHNDDYQLEVEYDTCWHLDLVPDPKSSCGTRLHECDFKDVKAGMGLTDTYDFKAEIIEAQYAYRVFGCHDEDSYDGYVEKLVRENDIKGRLRTDRFEYVDPDGKTVTVNRK